MPSNGKATDSTSEGSGGSEDEATEGGSEWTRFERAFRDRPVERDLALFAFLAVLYGGSMWLLVSVPAAWAVGMGVAFAVGWLALMELYCRYRGTSMLRSVGDDPLGVNRER
jgi:hypothetical protein